MKIQVTKHAKGLFEVEISTLAHHQSASEWEPFHNLYRFPEYKDLKKEINMVESSEGDQAVFTFKTDVETYEIIVDILSDHKYYNLTQMKEILNLMK